MTVSRLAGRSAASAMQEGSAQQPVFDRLDREPVAALGHTARRWSTASAGSRFRSWSGDQLAKSEPPGRAACTDHTGAVCPRFAQARVEQALAERQLIELNHRLANQLQILGSRIERQRRTQDDPAKQDELESLATSIRASAQLHRYLLPPRTDQNVDVGPFLMNVATAIADVTGLFCDVEVESIDVPSQVAVDLATAVNELAWNAYKHAYNGAEDGNIWIACRRDPDGLLRLSVADQGCGLPIDFDPRVSEGLGLMVVCATARRFGGELRVESDGGTRFTLLLNIPR